MSAPTIEALEEQILDMDELMALARELDEQEETLRPAVLCNIVGAT